MSGTTDGEAVVISGISGLYPMSHHLKEFSEILYNKINPTLAKHNRWTSNHPEVSKYTGTIPGLNHFDSQFFKVQHSLAVYMDVMSRKILEQTFQAVYDAGLNPSQINGKNVGVYIGTSFSECEKAQFYIAHLRTGLGITGCSKTMFANRISYWLNLHGPSVAIDEACCSSSCALAQAYDAVNRGDCEAAIVGGANLVLHPQTSIHFGRTVANSPDGKTRSFDDNANGCTKSEAIQVVFLQKAKNALRIYAKLVHIKTGFLSAKTEKSDFGFYRDPAIFSKFLKDFYYEANVPPENVEYVEAMGVAIPDSDKVELEVISETFCKNRRKPLLVGSIISNIGYTEASTGLCSLIKVLLAYHTGEIPANLHCSNPRSDVPALCNGKIRIVTENEPFARGYVGINNLAITGCTTHFLVSGQYKPKDRTRYKSSIPHLLVISGRNESAVHRIIDELKSRPLDPEELALLHKLHNTNISGHLARGFAILDTNAEQKTTSLTEQVQYFDEARRPLWFVYSGMGSQWAGMGAQLMRIPIFAVAIEKCRRALEPKGIDLIHIITSTDKKIFDNILHSFVGIAAIQIGLTDILLELGLVPDKMIGHSVGELGCAYADGCFTAEEMILSAYSRGLVSLETPFIRGSMAAVGLGFQDVKDMLPPEIEVACHNSAESSTLSGPAEAMQEFVASLSSKGIFAKEVQCSNIAYHSRYISKAGPRLFKYLSEVIKEPKQRSDRWMSTSVPRDRWDDPAAKTSSAQYHTNNLLNPVLFEETAKLIPPKAVLIEIAPHGLLQAILKRSLPNSCSNISLTRRGCPDNALMVLESIGKLFMEGYHPRVEVLYPKIDFPVSTGTPMLSHLVEWVYSDYWYLPLYATAHRETAAAVTHCICTHDPEYSYLSGNVIGGKNVYPYAAALVAAWDTLAMVLQKPKEDLSVTFSEVEFFSQPILNDIRPLRIHVKIHRGQGRFEVTESNSMVATGYISEGIKDEERLPSHIGIIDDCDIDDIYNDDDIYRILFDRGYSYGGAFRSIKTANKSLTKAKLLWNDNWVTLLDGMLQLNVLRQNHNAITRILGIRKICIDLKEHCHATNTKEKTISTVIANDSHKIRCDAVTIESMKFEYAIHSKSEESLQFVHDFELLPDECINGGDYHASLNKSRLMSPYISLRSKNIIGDLPSLAWVEMPEPVASGISVKVHYVGLNTIDAVRAVTTCMEKEGDIENISYGMDFSGLTENGDRVMGLVASGAASNRVTAYPDLLWPVPKHWTMEDAATVPMPYAFAFYAFLTIQVQMESHESILVHGGTGALGQAVISIALAHRMQVFTTVSDHRKKNFLLKLFPEIKKDHVGNSRDLSFGDMVMTHTKGLGVSYVFNCTNGELRDVSIRCLRRAGQLIDTVHIPKDKKYILGMGHLSRQRSYYCVDFSTITNETSDRVIIQRLVSEGIRQGYVRPLSRLTYEASDVSRAFHLLRASQHRGRVLLSLRHQTQLQSRITYNRNQTQVLVCDDESLGVHIVDTLVKRGAKKVLLQLSNSTSLVLFKKQLWQNDGTDVKEFTHKLENINDVRLMLNEANNMGTVESIHVVKMERNANAYEEVLNSVDEISRKLCPQLKYFSIVSTDKNFGKETCLERVKKNLPVVKISIPSTKKADEVPEENSNIKITPWQASDALEYALPFKQAIIQAKVLRTNKNSLLQRIGTLADIIIPEQIEDDVSLDKLGVTVEKVSYISAVLCDEYNVSLSAENILSLTVKNLREIEQIICEREPKEIKGLAMFFSYLDSDELSATTDIMLMPTLTNNTKMRDDEFDTTKKYLCIIPGLEGHHEKFRNICERIKMPALVIQPGLDLPNESIEETAARYAGILTKTISVKDNFYLLGYESGVMIALETAAILETHGLSGTIYLIGTTPDQFKTILERELRNYKNDEELQTAILKHMYKLISGTELGSEIDEISEWKDRIEFCVRDLLGRVSLSAQYTRLNLSFPYYRIKKSQEYRPRLAPLRSKIVFLQPNSCDNNSACEELRKYSEQPVTVHNMALPFSQVLEDLRCASFINQHLDEDIIEIFKKINLCETYLMDADKFITIKNLR